jgi:carboxypeptidase Taq
MKSYQSLKEQFEMLYHMKHADAILSWDEAVMMPNGGANARQHALSSLRGLSHEKMCSPLMRDTLKSAKEEGLSSAWDIANLRLMEKQYLHATCLPNKLVKALSHATLEAEHKWRTYRAENNWQAFQPYLEKVIGLVKEKAIRLSDTFSLSPYDALLDEFSPGLNTRVLSPLFDTLKEALPTLVEQVLNKQKPLLPFNPPFAIEKQAALGQELMGLIGFDFSRGRLDVSHHPFCGGVSEDVRITTRYDEKEFMTSLMGVCHETGHAMYEFGLPADYLSQPVGQAPCMSIHESQSLLVEMGLCRSNAFIKLLLPKLVKTFGAQPTFSLENLRDHYLNVSPGLIRVDADELTYPLHIILRYELEKRLIEDDLNVDALPALWDEGMKKYFNLSTATDNKNGVMQDVHWPSGAFGYFPAYTIGALMAAQLYEAMEGELGSINQLIDEQRFDVIMAWLRKNIHGYGARYTFDELMRKATGKPLDTHAFLNHVKKRYL